MERFAAACPVALLLATQLLLLPPAQGAAPAARNGSASARAVGCLIEPDRVADIGSQVVGVVEQMHVERGDSVRAGQNLVTLRGDVERANMGVAETRSRVDAEILASRASLDLALQKVRRADSLVAQNFVSQQAVEQARGEAEVARQKLNQVESQRQIWIEERKVAQAQLALRTVRSPFTGVVVERYVNQGERVEERPMLRLAVINPLRVELLVPTALYGRLAKGDQIQVSPELPDAQPVTATVRHVDRVLDAASNSYRVRLTLPNPGNKLPAGLRCKADVPGADALPAETTAQAVEPAGTISRPRPAPAANNPDAAAPKRPAP
jgi:membrane fusion protein, heavy metal efflux system